MLSKRMSHLVTEKTLYTSQWLEKSLYRMTSLWSTTHTYQSQPCRPSESEVCLAKRVCVTIPERKDYHWFSLIQTWWSSLCYLKSFSTRPKLNWLVEKTHSVVSASISRQHPPRYHSSASVKSKRAESHQVPNSKSRSRMGKISQCATAKAT